MLHQEEFASPVSVSEAEFFPLWLLSLTQHLEALLSVVDAVGVGVAFQTTVELWGLIREIDREFEASGGEMVKHGGGV